jgi:tRNA(adenine34) deaminase
MRASLGSSTVAPIEAGAAGSLFDLAADPRLNHRIAVTAGVGETRCRALLQDFFRARRHATD